MGGVIETHQDSDRLSTRGSSFAKVHAMPHEIFISYSSRDKLIADEVCARLEKRGISCWIAPRDLPGGSNWDEDILDAIKPCEMVLLLLSSESNKSKEVKRELKLADYFKRYIVPLRIEDVEPSEKLLYLLIDLQRVDAFPPPLPQYLEKLVTVIQSRLDKLKSNSPEVSIEIADDKGQPGAALVAVSLQSPATTATESQITPVVSQKPARDEEVPKATSEAPPSGLTSPPQAVTRDRSQRTPNLLNTGNGELLRGAGLVGWSSMVVAGAILFGGMLHDGIVGWKATSPTELTIKDPVEWSRINNEIDNRVHPLTKDLPPIQSPGSVAAQYAIKQAWLAENPEPKVFWSYGSIQSLLSRVISCIDRAMRGSWIPVLWGLAVGTFVGVVWWIIFGIAARAQRRPLEMVYDDWAPFFDLQTSCSMIITGIFVVVGGTDIWTIALGLFCGSVLGLCAAGREHLSQRNLRRQKAILGIERGTKTAGD